MRPTVSSHLLLLILPELLWAELVTLEHQYPKLPVINKIFLCVFTAYNFGVSSGNICPKTSLISFAFITAESLYCLIVTQLSMDNLFLAYSKIFFTPECMTLYSVLLSSTLVPEDFQFFFCDIPSFFCIDIFSQPALAANFISTFLMSK